MSKRIFTREQIKELLKNKNVVSCTEKTITYSKDFKKTAIKMYEQGSSGAELFRQARFDLNLIGRNQPKECMRRWKNILRKKGLKGLDNTRGKNKVRSKTKNLTDAERIKWMETEITYLKAENDFLAKLRAKRTE